MEARVGSQIGVLVKKKDGREIRQKVHNLLPNQNSKNKLYISSYLEPIQTHSSLFNWGQLDGTFSQSGTTITRESGTGDLSQSGMLLVFEDGSNAYYSSGSGASCEVSKSQNVSAQNLYFYDLSDNPGFIQITNESIGFSDYVKSVNGSTLRFVASNFPVTIESSSSSSYKLLMFSIEENNISGSKFKYVLDEAVDIEVGDSIIIESLEFVSTYSNSGPITITDTGGDAFAGLDTGDVQFMRLYYPYLTDSNIVLSEVPEFHFMGNGNEIALPDLETIGGGSDFDVSYAVSSQQGQDDGGVAYIQSPKVENNRTSIVRFTSTIGNSYTNIKQILIGSDTDEGIYGFTFQNPVDIPAGTILTFDMRYEVHLEGVPLPSHLASLEAS